MSSLRYLRIPAPACPGPDPVGKMGNQLVAKPIQDIRTYLQDLPNYVYHTDLTGGKILKTLKCLADDRFVVVKVYVKRDTSLSLDKYKKRILSIRDLLNFEQHPNIVPFQRIYETDTAGYLVRQYFANNLYDRFSTHPFLNEIEKIWFVYQLLRSISQCHNVGVCHGDIKSENCLVTSWNWLFLSDIALHKPAYLPVDNPADYSYYFDTGLRRRCFVAPERFFHPQDKPQHQNKDSVTPEMDIFSCGCVIAEIFLEGDAIFDLPQVLLYREGKFTPALSRINNTKIKDMVSHMIQRDPTKRGRAKDYLRKYTGTLFPPYFPYLFQFCSYILLPENSQPDSKIHLITDNFNELTRIISGKDFFNPYTQTTQKKQEDLSQYSSDLKNNDEKVQEGKKEDKLNISIPSVDISNLTLSNKETGGLSKVRSILSPRQKKTDKISTTTPISDGYSVIISLISSCIRNVRFPLTKLKALDLYTSLSSRVDDDIKISRLIPYVIAMINDSSSSVRAASIHTLAAIVNQIQYISPADSTIFPDYIFPALSRIPDDEEELVHIAYATELAKFAERSKIFLDLTHFKQQNKYNNVPSREKMTSSISPEGYMYMNMAGSTGTNVSEICHTEDFAINKNNLNNDSTQKYNKDLIILRRIISKLLMTLLSTCTSVVKRAVLSDISRLCAFFGRQLSLDEILPLLISLLNDSDWLLRAAFFDSIVGMAVFFGRGPLQTYILPTLEQKLFDIEDIVVYRALQALNAFAQLSLLDPEAVKSTLIKTTPFLCHPNRDLAIPVINFISSIAKQIKSARARILLLPYLRSFLYDEPVDFTRESFLSLLLPPISHSVFEIIINIINNTSNPDTIRVNTLTEMICANNNSDSGFQSKQGQQLLSAMLPYFILFSRSRIQHAKSASITAKNASDTNNSQTLHRYVTLNDRIPVHATYIERTIGEKTSDTLTKINEDLFENLGIGISTSNRENSDKSNSSIQDSLTQTHKETLIIQDSKLLPDSLKRAISLPPAPPELGKLHLDTISTSLFYRNCSFIDLTSNSNTGTNTKEKSKSPLGWHPHGTLITNLTEHTCSVNCIAVSCDNSFLASGSDDASVKIWDTQTLSKGASVLTYTDNKNKDPILALAICDSTHSIAVGIGNSVHVFIVDVLFYNVNRNVTQKQISKGYIPFHIITPSSNEGTILAIIHYNTITESLLVYATLKNFIHGFDLRSKSEVFVLEIPSFMGYITKIAAGPCLHVLCAGTSRGFIILWDLRVQIPIHIFRHPAKMPIITLYPLNAVSTLDASKIHHFTGGPLLFIACQNHHSIMGFDVFNGTVREVFSMDNSMVDVVPSLETVSLSQDQSDFFSDYKSTILNNQHSYSDIINTSITGFLCCRNSFILTAGSDSVIRYWDINDISESYSVVKPNDYNMGDISRGSFHSRVVNNGNTSYFQETLPDITKYTKNNSSTITVKDMKKGVVPCDIAHNDVITDMKAIEYPQNMIATSSRDGSIKIYV